jgi:hypothetical protein
MQLRSGSIFIILKMPPGYLQVRETPPETSAGHSSGPAAKNNNIKTGFNQLVK